MLDKKTARFLAKLNQFCADGSYKIIEKSEPHGALNAKAGGEPGALAQLLRYLSDNELIDVKYTDEAVCCLSVLPKGRVALEERHKSRAGGVRRPDLVLIALVSFAASFFGAFVAVILGGLF
jgi:hypothetical protein